MPTNDNIFDQKIRFYNRIYRGILLILVLGIMVLAAVGVRQIFIISHRIDQNTQQINRNMACIVSIFAQPNRQQITVDNINKCILVRE